MGLVSFVLDLCFSRLPNLWQRNDVFLREEKENRLRCVSPEAVIIGQDLLLGLKSRAQSRPKKMAAVMPPAVAVTPPVKAPVRPFSLTAL